MPHLVLDGFLRQVEHDRLLAYAQSEPDRYGMAMLRTDGNPRYNPDMRLADTARYGLGPYRRPLESAIRAHLERIFAELRMPAFEPHFETELVAHRHGGYFRPHVDTLRDFQRDGSPVERLKTAVYYLHKVPRGFSGGELALFPDHAEGTPLLFEPLDNRLVVFPASAWHEVLPVDCPGNALIDARFSVNCWLVGPRSED